MFLFVLFLWDNKEVPLIPYSLFLAFYWLNNNKSWGSFLVPCAHSTHFLKLLKREWQSLIFLHYSNHIRKQQQQKISITYKVFLQFFNQLGNTWALHFPSVLVSALPVFFSLIPFRPSNTIFCNSLYFVLSLHFRSVLSSLRIISFTWRGLSILMSQHTPKLKSFSR